MKTRFYLLLFYLVLVFPVLAQEEEQLKRPADIKVTEYDEFKNTSFDTYDESLKLKKNMTVITGFETKVGGAVHREGPAGALSGAPPNSSLRVTVVPADVDNVALGRRAPTAGGIVWVDIDAPFRALAR